MTDLATDTDPDEAPRREAVMEEFGELLNADDFEDLFGAFQRHLDPEIEWIEDPSWPGATNSHGLEELARNSRERLETFQWHQSIERFFHTGDVTVAFAVWRARGRMSGAETELSLAEVATWRDGKIARMQFIIDRDRALREAGIQDR